MDEKQEKIEALKNAIRTTDETIEQRLQVKDDLSLELGNLQSPFQPGDIISLRSSRLNFRWIVLKNVGRLDQDVQIILRRLTLASNLDSVGMICETPEEWKLVGHMELPK